MVSVLSFYLDFIVYLLVFILNYTNLVYFQLSLKSKNILQSQPFFYVFILKNKNVLYLTYFKITKNQVYNISS